MAMIQPYLGIEGHDHVCIVGALFDKCPYFVGVDGPFEPIHGPAIP